MIINFEQVNTKKGHSFLLRHDMVTTYDTMLFHQHPEYELSYVVDGTGERIIGDYVESFQNGDLIFIPPNIPHCWLYEPRFAHTYSAESYALQFRQNIIESNAHLFPELLPIVENLNNIQIPIKISGTPSQRIAGLLKRIDKSKSLEQLILFWAILEIVSNTSEIESNLGVHIFPNKSSNDMQRIQKIYSYVMDNYQQKITLSEAASIANMGEAAFCCFFKRVTHKSFITFLNEYRIKIACQKLRENTKSVSEICFASGFSDIPHFNRVFKREIGVSPLKYRQRIFQKINM